MLCGKNNKQRVLMPSQILDCAVKYSSRLYGVEYPSYRAVKRLKSTPPSEKRIISVFKAENAFFIITFCITALVFAIMQKNTLLKKENTLKSVFFAPNRVSNIQKIIVWIFVLLFDLPWGQLRHSPPFMKSVESIR